MTTPAGKYFVNPLVALVTANTREMLFRRNVILPLSVALLPVLALALIRAGGVRGAVPDAGGDGGYELYAVLCASFYLQFLVPLLALLKGLSIFSREQEEGTLIYLFIRPVPRIILIAGKFLAFWISTSIIVLLSLGAAYLLLGGIAGLNGVAENFGVFTKDVGVLCLGLGAYGAALMTVGVLVKRSLGVGILLLAWDMVATYIPGSTYLLTVKYYLQSIFPHQRTEPGLIALLSYHPPASLTQSMLTLIGVLVVGIGLSTFLITVKE